MEHRCAAQRGDVRPVIDRPQLSVRLGDGAERGEEFELLRSLDGLLTQLNDVHAARIGGVDEVVEIPLTGPRVGAQVQLG